MPQRFRRNRLISLSLAAAVVAGVAATVAPATASAKITGPDVANYQHPQGAGINWRKVAKAGASFAIVKATEGTGYTNPYFASDYKGIGNAGLVRGSYHFARPANPVASSAKAQAAYFASTVDNVDSPTSDNTLPPALDLEVTGGLSRSNLIRWAQLFLIDLRDDTGRTPLLYTYPSFWTDTLGDPAAFTRFPIWMASYGSSQPSGSTLWQYTSTDHIRGIKGDVDMSRYVGTTAWPWSTVSDGTVATPWDPSAPGAPVGVGASVVTGETTSAAAAVHWLPGDSGTEAISSYTVTASPGGATTTVSGGSTSATVTGLSPGIEYTFTVTATNSVGTGVASTPSNAVSSRTPTQLDETATGHVAAGKPVTISGTLHRADDGTPIADRPVTLSRRGGSSQSWHTVATLQTDSSGAVSFLRHPRVNTRWQLSYPGGGRFGSSEDMARTWVRPVVTVTDSPTSTVAGQRISISAAISPVSHSIVVEREVQDSDGTWTVAQHRRWRSAGDVRFWFRDSTVGTSHYRIEVLPTSGRRGAKSDPVSISASAPTSS